MSNTAILYSKEYAKKDGVVCPFCYSKDIEGYSKMETDSTFVGRAWQNMSCIDCNAEWRDEYSLTGYSTFGDEDE